MLHCHVNQHSDTGVAALLEVAADAYAQGPLDEPTFLRLGSCPAVCVEHDRSLSREHLLYCCSKQASTVLCAFGLFTAA
jgi:hypothetical protein